VPERPYPTLQPAIERYLVRPLEAMATTSMAVVTVVVVVVVTTVDLVRSVGRWCRRQLFKAIHR
jgi:hypothetical protein